MKAKHNSLAGASRRLQFSARLLSRPLAAKKLVLLMLAEMQAEVALVCLRMGDTSPAEYESMYD